MIKSVQTLSRVQVGKSDKPDRFVQVGGGAAVASGIRRFRLKSVSDDYLVCRSLTGDQGSEDEGSVDVAVAKPWNLQKSPWNAATRGGYSYGSFAANGTTRVSTRVSDSDTENQSVTPGYVVADEDWDGDVITAIRADTGLTYSGKQVVWQEVSERAWAKLS